MPVILDRMETSRFIPKYREAVIVLHRKTMARFSTGISREEEEADLRAGEFLVGLLRKRLIAMGGFKPKSPHTAELKRIRIDPLEQGKGHGSQLLQALELRAAKKGFSILCLELPEQDLSHWHFMISISTGP